jgi:hypothetical protein
MKIPPSPFIAIDWTDQERLEFPGEIGVAQWRTHMLGDIRIRVVDYSPGYLADHWCDRGHILFVAEGELTTELFDGRKIHLTKGMSYHVSEYGDAPHRSSTSTGATIFVVD